MRLMHLILAILVAVVWGCNFIFIKLAINEISPLSLSAARFFLASIPLAFFIKRPAVPFKMTAFYGLIVFGVQFSLLFIGMRVGMTAGVASLIAQTQVFFTILFVAVFLGERPTSWQIIGGLISFTGIGLVGLNISSHISLLGLILVVASAASWGVGNLIAKKMGQVNMIALVVWGSLIAFPPLFLISLWMDGGDHIIYNVSNLSWLAILSVSYIVYLSTWFGYGVWNWLLSQYPVATVAPFTLLVPVFGMMGSVLVFNEPMESWKVIAGILVIVGLCINLLGSHLKARKNIEELEIQTT